MPNTIGLRCHGCGQIASPEHISRRLRRLEWATRYRPIHIQTLLLGGVAPRDDAEFLYAPGEEFRGDAGLLLRAVGISTSAKATESVQAEFQSAGLFLTYLLECPVEGGEDVLSDATKLLREHLSAAASRIRRSLKPRRVILVTEVLESIVEDILALDLGCAVVSDKGKSFTLSTLAEQAGFSRFREALAAAGGN